MINGALAVILNIIMMLVFVRYVGYIGIPLATSISSILMVVLLGYHLRKNRSIWTEKLNSNRRENLHRITGHGIGGLVGLYLH